MSKCHVNWARTPNSQMDRKHRPKQFFREKGRVERFHRLEEKEAGTDQLEREAEISRRIASADELVIEKLGLRSEAELCWLHDLIRREATGNG